MINAGSPDPDRLQKDSFYKVLLRLERLRYRKVAPELTSGGLRLLAWYWTIVFAGCLIFQYWYQNLHPEVLLFGNSALFITLIATSFFMAENAYRMDPSRDWILRLPVSRFSLVRARFSNYCRLGYMAGGILLTASVASWLATVALGWTDWPLPPSAWSKLPAITGIVIVSVPLLASASLFSNIFFRKGAGWAISFVIIITIQLSSAPAGMGIFFGMISGESSATELGVSEQALWLILAGTLLLGIPLCIGMLRQAAKIGFRNLADPRNLSGLTASHGGSRQRKTGDCSTGREAGSEDALSLAASRSSVNAYRALLHMELRRNTFFSGRSIRGWISALAGIAFAVGGYLAAGIPASTILVPLVCVIGISLVFVFASSIYLSVDAGLGRLKWWLLLPVSRRLLLAAKLRTYFLMGLETVVFIYATFWAGLVVRLLVRPVTVELHLIGWTVYFLLLWAVLFGAVMLCFFLNTILNHIYPRSAVFTLFPIAFIFFQKKLLSLFVPKLSLFSELPPYWNRLGLTAAACLVVGLLEFKACEKLLNRLMGIQERNIAKK